MAEKKPVEVEGDFFHPLATLHWEHYHTWEDWWVEPRHCAVLRNTVAILDCDYQKVYISSTDLHEWITIILPYSYSALTTYQSKFVLVGGHHPSTPELTNQLWTSTTGLNWETSLPAMPTKRYHTSSISGGSPEVLVVAGGVDSHKNHLNVVEVLIGDHWSTAASLPTPCSDMRSTLHEGNFYFTGGLRQWDILYTCSSDSLIESARKKKKTTQKVWKKMTIPDGVLIIASYSSCLIKMARGFNFIWTGYSNATQTWLKLTNKGSTPDYCFCVTAAVLSTGQLIFADNYGLYKGTPSVSTFDPDARFIPNVLSRLEAVMGVQIVSVLANYHSQLTISSGIELQRKLANEVLPDPGQDPIQYIKEVILQWSMGHSHRPPTWKQLLDVLQNIGLTELSQQIEAFMRGEYKFENAYKHFIDSKDVLELLCMKFMFLGPPRQGKSTTRRRVMKEIVDLNSAKEADQVHVSTGIVECCPNMLVQDKSDQATAESRAEWTIVQNLAGEACLLFHCLKDSLETEVIPEAAVTSSVTSEIKAEVSQASSTIRSIHVNNPSQPKLLQKMMLKMKFLTKTRRSRLKSSPAASLTPEHTDIEASIDYSEVAAMFKEVSRQPEFAEHVKHSFKAFLRIEDTGGHPALMDMLPALTIGPGLYLLLFSYEFKLNEEYQVFYQRDLVEKTTPVKSEFTLQDMLLCMLSSISCCNESTHAQPLVESRNSEIDEILESSKSVVYIVGTHKDKVSAEYISAVDRQFQEVIRDTEYYKKKHY